MRDDSASAESPLVRSPRKVTFDERSARMKSTWRGSFELFELEKSRNSEKAEICRGQPLIDDRVRLAVPFVAGVASTREASRSVGANGIGVTINRAQDALIDA